MALHIHPEYPLRHQLPQHGAPLVDGDRDTDAEGGQVVVVVLDDAVAELADEYVYHIVGAEGLPRSVDR